MEELDETLSAQELQRWMVYYNIEPFGAWRDNWHAAMALAMTANLNRGRGKPALSSDDFMFKDPQTTHNDHIKEMMARFNAASKPKDTH